MYLRRHIRKYKNYEKDVIDVRREYSAPEMTIEEIEIEDVITRSGPGRPGMDEDDDELI